MPKTHAAVPELASLLDGSSAGELIPELARHGLQQLIELELAAFLGADWYERTEERLGHRNGYRPRTLTTQVGDLALRRLSGKKSARGAALSTSESLLRIHDHGLRDRMLIVIEC